MIPAASCSPLSEIILFGSPCSFQMLSLNDHASSFALVLSVVGTKCTIFVNLSTTTKIELYPCTKGNFVIKSVLIVRYALDSPLGIMQLLLT